MSYEKDKDVIHLTILDGGEGISESKINQIKKSDKQIISQIGTGMEVGTGIGLLLVKQFIKRIKPVST